MKYTVKKIEVAYEAAGNEKVSVGVDEITVEFAAGEYLEATKAICGLAKDLLASLKKESAAEKAVRAAREWAKRQDDAPLHESV